MTKSINTLITDVYEEIKRRGGIWTDGLDSEVAIRLLQQQEHKERRPSLRLSKLGPVCPCALWHSIHTPELAEKLPPWAIFKYGYGHMIEAAAIGLAKASGHLVTGEQDELTVDGILGHRDCVLDGNIVDIKSCSSRSFQKFKDGSIKEDDPFGYLDQIDAYVLGSRDDDLVTNKRSGYLWAIDKTLGHMVLYEHQIREAHIRGRIERHKDIVARQHPPTCECETRPDGKSGNIALGIKASYSPFKFCCFRNLRTFLYADGPRYLVHVERKPDVPEVDKEGRIVYH